MKNNLLKNLLMLFVIVTINSCENDDIVYDNTQFLQIANGNSVTILENSTEEIEIEVIIGSPQSQDVTVTFEGDGDVSRYTLSQNSVVIPVGETSESISFSTVDNDDIDGDIDITISLSSSSSLPIGIGGSNPNGASKVFSIVDDNVPCNDGILTVTTDAFPEETTWEVTDSEGNILASGGEDYGPPSSADSRGVEYVHNIFLEDGCYTFTIFDTFGDGLNDGTFEGSYSYVCDNIVYAEGMGSFSDGDGTFEATDFCVNQ